MSQALIRALAVVFLTALAALQGAFAEDDMVGVYSLEKTGMEKAALDQMRKEFEKGLEALSEEQRKVQASRLPQWEDQITQMIKDMSIELAVHADRTFTVTGQAGQQSMSSKGTWRREGETVLFTTTHTNGVEAKAPEEVAASFKNGVLRLKPDPNTPFELVMIKKKK